jgi:hypothetical protein
MKLWCPFSGIVEIRKPSTYSLTPVVSMPDLILLENRLIKKYVFEENFSEHDRSVKVFCWVCGLLTDQETYYE